MGAHASKAGESSGAGASSNANAGNGKNVNEQQQAQQAAVDDIHSQIDVLRAVLSKPFEPSGRKGWQQQLDADTKRKAEAERKIKQLEKKLEKQERQKSESKQNKESISFKWQRAGEGWYIGQNGYEIRQNYDSGGYDVVKASGRSAKTVKHFAKLSDARKYNP